MPQAKTIKRIDDNFPPHLDFKFLREEGLRRLGALSGEVWTDHNSHDPGITILESLCFALLDLGYRTNHDIENLLATKDPNDFLTNQFFSAAQILSNNPLTVNDYRKLLIDIPGVKNAWLEKAEHCEVPLQLDCRGEAPSLSPAIASAREGQEICLNGLYKVWLELDTVRPTVDAGCSGEDDSVGEILKEAWRRLRQHRNLCEDFVDICILQPEQISICGVLEILPDKNPEDVLTQMFLNLQQFLSPSFKFYTLKELLDKGRSTDEIFEGRPLLSLLYKSHGFLDTDDLQQRSEMMEEVHASDFYRVILDTPGLRAVTQLKLTNYIGGTPQSQGDEWRLKLTKGYYPVIAPELGNLVVLKDGIRFPYSTSAIANRVKARLTDAEKTFKHAYDLDLIPKIGRYLEGLGDFYSIQNEFPSTYRIGQDNLPKLPEDNPLFSEGSVPQKARRAQALQLKGFLLFFDQLLADYVAQLGQIRQHFLLKSATNGALMQGNLSSVPDLPLLIRNFVPGSDGLANTGTSVVYRHGETVLYPIDENNEGDFYNNYLFMATPSQRDNTLRQLKLAFESKNFTSIGVPDGCGNAYFELVFKIAINGEPLRLRSRKAYGPVRYPIEKTPEEVAVIAAESFTFLGLQKESFKGINQPKEHRYSFELVYQPIDYQDFVRSLNEPGDSALQRRNLFLDHLLARFNEDFTEYALQSYAMQPGLGKPDAEFTSDKEAFLSNYDSISRNRGRGFDYSVKEKLWDTDNISGLEMRAAGLLGIDDMRRRSLSPFEVVERKVEKPMLFYDYQGRVLLQSKKHYEKQDDTFFEALKNEMASSNSIRPVNCLTYGTHGFELVKNAGTDLACTIAQHPFTYGTAALRNQKIYHVKKLFEGNGLHQEFEETVAGWMFWLYESDAVYAKLLLQSTNPATTEEGAFLQWARAKQLGKDENHWKIVEDLPGGEFSLLLMDETGNAIAEFPDKTPDLEELDAILQSIRLLLAQSKIDARIIQRPTIWSWQLRGDGGKVLLDHLYPFATKEQAAVAMTRALKLAKEITNYELVKDSESGKLSFILVQKIPALDGQPLETLRLAAHPGWYDTEFERTQALTDTVACAAEEAEFKGKILPKNNAMRYLLTDEQGDALMLGTGIYPSVSTLEAAWAFFVQRGASRDNYRINSDEGFAVWLADPCEQPIACSAKTFEDEQAAQDFIMQLSLMLAKGDVAPNTELLDTAFTFRLLSPQGEPILIGQQWYERPKEAKAAYLEAVFAAKNPDNWQDLTATGVCKVQLLGAESACGAPLAISIENFATVKSRDESLMEWQNWYSGPGIKPCLVNCPGKWYFEIWKDGQIALTNIADFESDLAAAAILEQVILDGCDATNFTLKTDGCLCSFDLHDADDSQNLIATHPHWHDPNEGCADFISTISKCLCEERLPVKFDFQPAAFRWKLIWETCDDRLLPALEDVAEPPAANYEDALANFNNAVKDVENNLKKGDGPSGSGPFSIYLVDEAGKTVAVHPETYLSKQQRDTVYVNLKSYLEKGYWGKAALEDGANMPGLFFRLNKPVTIAHYLERFTHKETRDLLLSQFFEAIQCRGAVFSSIDINGTAVFKKEGRYYYMLKTGNKVWWQSLNGYFTSEAALEALETDYLRIIYYATDPDLYESQCSDGVACWFWLKDSVGNRIARTPDLPPNEDLMLAFEERLRHARTYPLFADGAEYCFQLWDITTNKRIFSSAKGYASPAEAWMAFEHFVELLNHKLNYHNLDNPNACWFSFEILEAGLEGTHPYTAYSTEDEAEKRFLNLDEESLRELNAWKALDESLGTLGEETQLVTRLETLPSCRFGVYWARSDWEIARHCHYYHSPSEREIARDELYRKLCCTESIFIAERQCGYFVKGDLGLSFQEEFGLWVLPANHVVGQISIGIERKDLALPEAITDLMHYARSEDCYVMVAVQQPTECGPGVPLVIHYQLGLLDENSQLIALGKTIHATEAGWEKEKEAAIATAWQFPIVRRDGGFAFQIAPDGEFLLEGNIVYPNFSQAWSDYELYRDKLRCDRNAYGRTETDDCGPFGINIQNPAAIVAKHPVTYACRSELSVVDELAYCLDSEGFHLAEHILLRPFDPADATIPICPGSEVCTSSFEAKDAVLCAADPYSFQATIVIPYWSRRFRNLDFRSFFERTLRQEAPAHVALRIIWLDVLAMRRFELYWHNWLENNVLGHVACARRDALKDFIGIMSQLKNTYPRTTRLPDDLVNDDQVILDYSSL